MKFVFLLLTVGGMISNAIAQVGINTTDPKAQLDIAVQNSSAPTITDGILIPRITDFSAAQPTNDQHGMLVFLATAKEDYPVGFYFWNHEELAWRSVTAPNFVAFYKNETTSAPTNIADGIYREGNVGIGGETDNTKLKVFIDAEEDTLIKTGIEVINANSSPHHVTYGILSENKSLTSDKKYGIKNHVSIDGSGIHYGIHNGTFQARRGEIYGIYNRVGRTYGVNDKHYGIYSDIGTDKGSGYVYGIYSAAAGEDSLKVYAGYFAGRVAIGVSPEEEYVLPEKRGEQGQVMVAGENGQVGWMNQGQKSFVATGTATGDFFISDDVFTLQVEDGISSITIPDASLNKGRMLVLLGQHGIQPKPFNFPGGETIIDLVTNLPITEINGGERLLIQSTGENWVVIMN